MHKKGELTFWACKEAYRIMSFNKQTTELSEAKIRIVKNLTTWLEVYSQAFTICKEKDQNISILHTFLTTAYITTPHICSKKHVKKTIVHSQLV